MNIRPIVELMVLDGYDNEKIRKVFASRGYTLTDEKIEEYRDEMDPTARGLSYEEQ